MEKKVGECYFFCSLITNQKIGSRIWSPGLTWTKLKQGFAWPQLMTDLAVSSHQSLQFKYTFGACVGPQLKFFPSGTMSNVCNRTSESSSTCCREIPGDVWRPGWGEASSEGFWRVQTFSLGSSKEWAGNSSLSMSTCWDLEMVSLGGLGAVCEGDVSLWATFLLLFSEGKSLLSRISSSNTWKNNNIIFLTFG